MTETLTYTGSTICHWQLASSPRLEHGVHGWTLAVLNEKKKRRLWKKNLPVTTNLATLALYDGVRRTDGAQDRAYLCS